jgi:hypothetical protein
MGVGPKIPEPKDHVQKSASLSRSRIAMVPRGCFPAILVRLA